MSKPKRKIRLCHYVCVRPAFTLWAVEPSVSARLRPDAKVTIISETAKIFIKNIS